MNQKKDKVSEQPGAHPCTVQGVHDFLKSVPAKPPVKSEATAAQPRESAQTTPSPVALDAALIEPLKPTRHDAGRRVTT
jgi:hypothetical protein